VRLSELGSMFRSELSGVLSGLSRVRQINLDDTHVFCRPDQAVDEVVRGLESIRWSYGVLGVEIAYARLSRRGAGAGREQFLGDDALWDRAERHLAEALRRVGMDYVDAPGEAAFYGPKIDVQVVDPAGREETLSTVQLDLVQPERFGLSYVGPDGGRHRPVMIHRGVLSAMERMVAHLLERYDGALPLWLAPVQVRVLPVADRHEEPAAAFVARLVAAGLRAEQSSAVATLGARVRQARVEQVPVVAVLGDDEVSSDRVSVRLRDGRRAENLALDAVVSSLRRQATERCRELAVP
jgi:threonyl-tRNA synthetase